MRIIVTGGEGFLGSHLVDRLVELGHDVHSFDNQLTGKNHENPEAHYHLIDITYPDAVKSAVVDIAPEWIFHTAAIARTPWTIEDPLLAHSVNATGTLNMLEAARAADVKRFIHSSSCIVYVPKTPYYVSKLAAEEYVRIYAELYGRSTIALRYSNIYGPRQSEEGPSPNVFAALRKSRREHGHIFITGDGEQTRDYTHVSDIVEANILAAQSAETGTYYVGTGVPTSLNQIAPHFLCPIEYVPERQGDIKHLVMDGSEFREKFGWEPKVSIMDGMKDVV